MSPGQARQGQVFKRCTRCNTRVPERRCPKCGARDSFTWAYVVDITPKDAQGRLIGKRRQRKSQGFATRAAAQDALNELQIEKKAGTHVDPSRMTLGEYLDSWVQRGCGNVRPTTLRGWESAIRNHVQPRIGLLPLQQVSRTDFELLYADLQANGYAKGPSPAQLEVYAGLARRWKAMTEGGTTPTIAALARDLERSEATVRYWIRRCHELGMLGGKPAPIKVGRGLSLKSVWNVHVCLRAALYDAMATDPPLLRKNPAAGAMREPDAQHEMVTFTREELDTFLEVSRGEREFALWWTIAYSGMRRGEALGLRWSDVKWNLNTLSVQQQLGLDDDDDGERDFAPPKTRHGRRPIGVDADTMHVLHEHRAAQEFERQSWGPMYRSELDLVFGRPDGSPEDPDSITHRFERAVERADLKSIRGPHGLRHTYATLSLEAGVDISVVSKQLGHHSIAFTAKIYAHVTERLRQAAAGKLRAYVLNREAAEPTTANVAVRDRSVTDSDSSGAR